MPDLTELANHYGSDKGTIGPSPDWPAHNYTDIYEAYLKHLRNVPINLLEIGLGVPGDAWDARIARGRNVRGGASIRMWHDYFPNAAIYGIDVNPATHLDRDRIRTYVVDQGDPRALTEFAASLDGTFDIIIDDGSHRPDHQQVTLAALFPHLSAGGLYFIEDLMDNGLDDPDTGRYGSRHVLSTRRVLRGFTGSGSFPQPHMLATEDELSRAIDSVSFHVPVLRLSATMRPTRAAIRNPRRLVRHVTRFTPNSERMCVIQKRR